MPKAETAYVIKAEVEDLGAATFVFTAQKTMYGGKLIAVGDRIFLIASENAGGKGLFARGVVEAVTAVARNPRLERQTPRVSVQIRRSAKVKASLGRADVRTFCTWDDGAPQTEINFKLYRQATDKIVGVTASTAKFLDSFL
ncbi:MAG: hypothetical protein BGP04_08835 [Rhizobiales bacterium 62-17]|nr:hypothetical protein [Hyphomicrobiales bacterium]OJY05474.1 MAG: hypothetical protein BGP04_08835 [Rhizobiales bacterium 62-17]